MFVYLTTANSTNEQMCFVYFWSTFELFSNIFPGSLVAGCSATLALPVIIVTLDFKSF